MEGTDFFEADLTKASLYNTNLSESHNLTQEQLDSALTDSTTIMPKTLRTKLPGNADSMPPVVYVEVVDPDHTFEGDGHRESVQE